MKWILEKVKSLTDLLRCNEWTTHQQNARCLLHFSNILFDVHSEVFSIKFLFVLSYKVNPINQIELYAMLVDFHYKVPQFLSTAQHEMSTLTKF